jgi:folate-binding protein YgfZ
MHPEWKEFLISNGATFDDSTLVSFGNSDQECSVLPQGNILCDLSHTGLIRVEGDDAENFLQNQLSNDLKDVTESHSQLSSYNTHKGRMICNLRIFKRGDAYYLELAHDLLETVLKKLRMYVMMSKVTLEDASDELAHFAFAGADAANLLESVTENTLQNVNDSVQYKTLTITRLHGDLAHFEIFGELANARDLWSVLIDKATPVKSNTSRYLNIAAVIPFISEASSTDWVPQMLNFERIDGISFTKGCYPGQEIVARLNYRGQTKRRTYRLAIQSNQIPAIGDSITTNDEKETEA